MPYTVVGLLGRGGTGVVELVEDERGRRLARKRLALYGSTEQLDTARRRLRREAEVLRRLAHPGIVALLGVEDDGESVVLTMPWMAGGSLHDRVALNGPMRAAEVEDLAAALLPALAAAHHAGVVHRDISPANILFSAEGHPVLADFGIAMCRSFTWGLTGAGMTIGTPAFMAPEQARGEPLGPAVDVFSLGACLHFALTGRSPTVGASVFAEPAALVQRAAAGVIEPLPAAVPESLRRLVGAMCDPDPALRPSAARAWPGSLRTWDVTAPTPAVGEPRRRRRRPRLRLPRLRIVLAVLAAAVVTAGAGMGAALLVRRATAHEAGAPAVDPTVVPATTLPPCQPLPYQPCGEQAPAPFTDGRKCIDGHDDYDGLAGNGCEAAPDSVDGSQLTAAAPIVANIVPRADVDRYTVHVADRFQLFCDGTAHLTLTAPVGATDRITVTDPRGRRLATALSGDGTPTTVNLPDPNCFNDDSTTLTVTVSSVSGNTADPYTLKLAGSY